MSGDRSMNKSSSGNDGTLATDSVGQKEIFQ